MSERLTIGDAEFWRRPLEDRMADFAELQAKGPFTAAKVPNIMSGEDDHFTAVARVGTIMLS